MVAMSCKKPGTRLGGNFDIIVPDTVKVGVSFIFSPTTYNKSGYTYQWDMGDGFTSTEISRSAKYLVSKTYTVSLVINGDMANKKSKQVFALPNYSFLMRGVHVKADTVLFSPEYEQPAGSSYFWSFGDGGYSTDARPKHVYADTGYYKVSLIVNDDSSRLVKSTIRIFNDPLYTDQITGAKHWHGTHTTSINGVDRNSWSIRDSSIEIHDSDKITTYMLGLLNERMIYQYEPVLSTADTLVYINGSGKIKFNHTINKTWLYFIYKEFPYSEIGHAPAITHELSLESP